MNAYDSSMYITSVGSQLSYLSNDITLISICGLTAASVSRVLKKRIFQYHFLNMDISVTPQNIVFEFGIYIPKI